VTKGEKRKFEHSKPIVAAKQVKKQYTAKENADYEKKKAGGREVKKEGTVAPAGEVKQAVWAAAHKGVDQNVVDKRKSDNECKWCGMKNHAWKYCGKPVHISVVYGGQARPNRQSAFAPKRRSHVPTVAVDSQGKSSQQAGQRPAAWVFEDDDIL